MKRGLIAILFLLPLLSSCVHNPGTTARGKYSDKIVTFSIEDDGQGGYMIQGPLPKTTTIHSGNKIYWTIDNNTNEGIVDYVLIDGFTNSTNSSDKAPFQGTAADQRFEYKSLNHGPGRKDPGKSKDTIILSSGESRQYEYKITVEMKSGTNAIYADPIMIISN